MTFEAVVTDVKEATYTVRNVVNGATHHSCQLCTMGVADWCISPGDYVLCKSSDIGRTYIIGEIKGRAPSTKGFRIGSSDADEFVITESGTLIHERGINSTIISDEGLTASYKKMTINGLGSTIEVTEDQVLITVGSSTITMTPTEIKLSGDASGGILKGKESQDQINALADKINSFITKFLGHGHINLGESGATCITGKPITVPGTPATPAPPSPLISETSITKPSLQSTVVKSS